MSEHIQPEGWQRPSGYSNGMKARGELVFVAGQVGWDTRGRMVGDGFVEQTRKALENVIAVLETGGARAEHLVRMTWYVVGLQDYKSALKEVGRVYREVVGDHYPAMTLVEVAGLVEPGAKVEIEATAVIPE